MKDCPRCHGSGEIGWNDSPVNDPQCAQEATCNVCHGEGAVAANEALQEQLTEVLRQRFPFLLSGCHATVAVCALAALGLDDLDAAVERGARGLHLDYKRERGSGSPNRALSRENLRAAWDQVVIKSWYRRKARAVLEAALAEGEK